MYYLLMFILLLSCSKNTKKDIVIPYYTNTKSLLQDTWKRPDLRVLYLKNNPHFWINTPKKKLKLSEALYDIGYYQESLGLGFQLLLSRLSSSDKGKNHFTLAQNYYALGNIQKSRHYLDKTLSLDNQYYYFYYARLEEYDKNFSKAIDLYQKALTHKRGEKDYIIYAYSRTLNSAVLFNKNKNPVLYKKYIDMIQNNPRLPKSKSRIIEKSLKL